MATLALFLAADTLALEALLWLAHRAPLAPQWMEEWL